MNRATGSDLSVAAMFIGWRLSRLREGVITPRSVIPERDAPMRPSFPFALAGDGRFSLTGDDTEPLDP
jgi:hypothetical protein